jgi:hypothetical protein
MIKIFIAILLFTSVGVCQSVEDGWMGHECPEAKSPAAIGPISPFLNPPNESTRPQLNCCRVEVILNSPFRREWFTIST